MSDWYPFKNGESIGQTGSEGGLILRDEEHRDGSRVTLEHRANRFAVTCGIYGWMVHTRLFDSENAALMGFDETKEELTNILVFIPLKDEASDQNMRVAKGAIADFVERCQ